MTAIKRPLSGAAPLFLLLSLTACAGKPLVRTETVYVDRPVSVAVDARLTAGVPEAVLPARAKNDDLAGFGESMKCRLIAANYQLEKIEDAQPGDPRHAVRWCERYASVCGGAR